MEHAKKVTSRMINSSVLDVKDDLDEKLERCYASVISLINGLSERETNDVLQAHVCKGAPQHEEVQLGLLYAIITDPKIAARSYRDLNLVTRDGLTHVLHRTNQLIHEKWIKLADGPRHQILWFTKELVRNAVNGAESVCHSLIRQIAGGDVSPKNMFLTESMLDIFTDNRVWLEKHQPLLASAVYTYLRVIVDHTNPSFNTLRQKEVDFVVALLRERWTDCMPLGRDLVRLLQYVARIPEIERIWKDILHNPTALSPTFTGVQQLMGIRTSRRHFISRLTPDMETKLSFLTSKVRFGQQKRYQDWFQRQYLSTPESQSLRCDLIRYICAVIHPSNELLCSDIIPRWAVIGWLLTTCTSNVAASNAKLSLFYDWLFFEPDKDSIMNIEPCILVMHHSMRPHPAITATLLDFMCRIMPNFYPPLAPVVKNSMYTALKTILQKRVLQSLSPLFDNPKLDRELRVMIRENFGEFCSADVKDEPPTTPNSKEPPPSLIIDTNNHHMPDNNLQDMGEFSDDDEEPTTPTGEPAPLGSTSVVGGDHRPPTTVLAVEPSSAQTSSDHQFMPINETAAPMEPVDISESLDKLDDEIKMAVIDVQSETDNEIQCNMMDRLIDTVIQNSDFDQDQAALLAHCLTQLFKRQFTSNIFPNEPDEESIEDSIGTPLFVIFRNLCQTPEEDPSRQPILLLLEEMYNKTPRIGYLFLYFLKVSKVHDDKMSAYKDFCNSMESKDITSCLLTDLQLCQTDDVRLFTFLIPDIYTQFPNIAIGNSSLLHLIVSSIDGSQLQDLICQILQGHLIMFRKDSFLSVLNASLEWETIEQYFLWQLIAAHNIPVEHLMPILPKLEFTVHAEALSSILVLLKQDGNHRRSDHVTSLRQSVQILISEEAEVSPKPADLISYRPSIDIMRPILCRQCKKIDLFAVSILKFWAQEYEDKLAEILHSLLTKTAGTPNRKRKQSNKTEKEKEKEKGPSMDQTLAHLEHMRSTCKNVTFLMNESLQQALQHVQTTCSEAMKTKFSELLALAEDFEDVRTTRVLRAVPSRRAMASQITQNKNMMQQSKQKKILVEDSDSSEESSDGEEVVKPPKAKKRKKTNVITVEDDSD